MLVISEPVRAHLTRGGIIRAFLHIPLSMRECQKSGGMTTCELRSAGR